jgi:predicted site-specific integrase-resolvase
MEKQSTSVSNTPVSQRAAHYVRMSTEHQQYSPENQLEVVRQYAASHQMEIVREYSDHGRSGLNIAGREASVIRLNPAIRDRVKSGHRAWPKT